MKEENKKEKTVYEKMKKAFYGRLHDVTILMQLDQLENESGDFDLIIEEIKDKYGELEDYGLSVDFADYSDNEGPTDDHSERFFRYQFSFGGPQEEIRIYSDGRIEFWYLDWFIGEHCDGSDFEEFIEYVTGLSVSDIQEKVLHFVNTGEDPKLY